MPRCSAGLWQTIRNSPLYSDLYSKFYWGTDLSVFCQACLHLLAAACDPMASRLVPTPALAATPLPASPAPAPRAGLVPPSQHTPAAAALVAGVSPGSGAHSHGSGGGGGGGSGISSVMRKSSKRDIREITNACTVGRLVELMVPSPRRDLHLRTSAARLLGNLIIQRPNVCLEIAYIGISSGPGAARLSIGSVGMDESVREVAYPAVGMRAEAGFGLGRVDGITALLCLARDTGVARGRSAVGATGSSDVQCQRMVAKCIEAISHTCHMEPAVKAKLLAMGFKESEVGQAMRMAGGTSVECAVTWLTTREETWGGPEDEFEMVEDAPIDLPTMLISLGGLDIMAEMLQEPDAEVQASLWKAISALTRVGARCRTVLRSRVGQEWIVPLISEYSGGADLMVGTDRTLQQRKGGGGSGGGGGRGQGIAGAGGSARDSLGSCKLEVVANMAADVETCQELLPLGLVLLLASAACAARAGDTVGARTCARGLYYSLSNSPDDKGEELWHSSWWPLEACGSGGTQALLHLCQVNCFFFELFLAMHIHTYIHTYIHTFAMHIDVYIHTYIHTYTYIYTHTHMHTHIHRHIHIYCVPGQLLHTGPELRRWRPSLDRHYTHTHAHTHTHTQRGRQSLDRHYTHTHAHTHTRAQRGRPSLDRH
jgi:hypothetical protein